MFGEVKKNKEIMQRAALLVFMSLIAFVLLLASPLHIWKREESAVDSSVFRTVALMMERGRMPYRDSFDHKGPLLYIINYIGRQISIHWGVWVIEFASMVITLVGMYKIARLKCNKVLACVAVLTACSLLFVFFEQGNLTEEYAMPFIAIALFIFLDYFLNRRVSCMRLILCGFCFAGVFLLRPNMISAWVVFGIAAVAECLRQNERRFLGIYIIWFFMGIGGMIVPIVIWMMVNDMLVECLQSYLCFNFQYISSSNRNLFSQKWQCFFVFLNYKVIILSMAISVYLAVKAKEERFLDSTYICYIVCTLWFIALSGVVYLHYGMILVPAVVFPIASMLSECGKRDDSAVVLLALLWLLGNVIMPDWLSSIGSVANIYENRHEENYSKVVEDICSIIIEKTSQYETISVYGNWDIIYVLSDRMHATRYSYQSPIRDVMPEILDEYIEGLEKEKPKEALINSCISS